MTEFYADRVKETSPTTGTGTLTLAGTSAGYQTFAAGIGGGNSCYYCIVHPGPDVDEWEVGLGTVTAGSPNTLSRDNVLDSSNSGSLVDFSTGNKDVFQTAPAYFFQNAIGPQGPEGPPGNTGAQGPPGSDGGEGAASSPRAPRRLHPPRPRLRDASAAYCAPSLLVVVYTRNQPHSRTLPRFTDADTEMDDEVGL